jgi:hypothetical protein
VRRERARLAALGLAGVAYAAALAVLGRVVLAPNAEHVPPDTAVPFLLAAVHAVVLLAAVPGLSRSEHAPDPRAWLRLGVLAAGGIVGGLPWRGAIPGLLVGLFGAALLGLRDLLRRVGVPESGARVTPVLVGALLLTTLAWSGPLIETMDDPGAGVDLALAANPLAAAARAVGFNWGLARPVTYDLFVAQYYHHAYPSPWGAVLLWSVVAAALAGAVLLVKRLRAL